MCSTKGYVFLAILVWNRVSILTILGWNRVWFGHSSLELGMFFGRSYFFIIWRYDHFHFNVYTNRVRAITACHMLWSHAGLQGFRFEMRYQIFDQVWNGFRKHAAHPHPVFLKDPPPPAVARCSSVSPWKLGLRIIEWSKPRMFCNKSLGKIKFRAFLKGVGPWILSLEIVDYFGTSEHWVVKKIRILISKTAMVGCCKLSLYANGSCDERPIYFRRWLKWCTK